MPAPRRRARRAEPLHFLILAALACCSGPPGTDPAMDGRDESAPVAAAAPSEATCVGRVECATCHERENNAWQGSHHDLAMQEATEETVLGNFDDATVTHFGVRSTFYRRDGKFFVRTDGPDGQLHDYEIAYTFGVTPLQQYLIAFPGGRYQALNLCWDTRPAAEGGQRWFHLYPDEEIPHTDNLHWTRLNQNWNQMCAECHSTDLRKGYDAASRTYETTWFEIDVSCEACHGPGSGHVAWAESGEPNEPGTPGAGAGETASAKASERGLVIDLKDRDSPVWKFDVVSGIAKRSPPRRSRTVSEMCARCHSRRSVLTEEYVHGRPLMDTHLPALLDGNLYHADGQILDEVYVYGSFIQSRMYMAGVTCVDCHDPHSLRLRGTPDGVCAQCHLPQRFDTPAHHRHQVDSEGASCVACHMPARKYMVVDPRRDHSFRIPRPDLTLKIGTPNACNGCHENQSATWAAESTARWYGPEASSKPHYGEAIHAGREGLPRAGSALAKLAEDPLQPGIARATALSLLRGQTAPETIPVIERSLSDEDPMVRATALEALEYLPPQQRLRLGLSLLGDPVRGVRVQAARALASVPLDLLSPAQKASVARAKAEYREAQRVNADRPEAQLNLAWLHTVEGDLGAAERAYLTARDLDPDFLPGYVNLADLYRIQGRDGAGERVLREGIERAGGNGNLHHALGLNLVRQRRTGEALQALRRAAELAPGEPRYAYVLGVALQGEGETGRALSVLKAAHERHPGDRVLLQALATISRDTGALEEAAGYARKLVLLEPRDAGARQLLRQLESRRR